MTLPAIVQIPDETNVLTSLSGSELLPLAEPIGGGVYQDGIVSIINVRKFVLPGYIKEQGAILSYVGGAAYDVSAGAAVVNGETLAWSSAISRSSLSLSVSTLYYVYLYNNSGTPAIEESTTVPVWDSDLEYFQKTGDATRRFIGWILTDASGNIRNFTCIVHDRVIEITYTDGNPSGRAPVAGATSTGAWTSFSLAIIPSIALDVQLLLKLNLVTANADEVLGVSPYDLGAGVAANFAANYIRANTAIANGNTFTGISWNPMRTANTYYYRTTTGAGTVTASIEVTAARCVR